MGELMGLMQVLWVLEFMETSKGVCTYYKLSGRENNYVYTILDTGLR